MFLFGNTDRDVVDETVGLSELRILTWNLQNPSLERAKKQADWLLETKANILILTEASFYEGSAYVISTLESMGFKIIFRESTYDRYSTAICLKGFDFKGWKTDFFSSRIEATIINTFLGELYVLGIYAPSSWGTLSQEQIAKRTSFHKQTINIIKKFSKNKNVLVGGDLNVLEPDQISQVPGFEDHKFYNDIIDLGFTDAYRLMNPDKQEHSWYSSTRIGLRLDHLFTSPSLTEEIKECHYKHKPRFSGLSDHSAMWIKFMR